MYEIKELDTLIDEVYYPGTIPSRIISDVLAFKGTNEQIIIKELDNEEDYYNVDEGDHLMYRYEVIKILGKGSFA